MGLFSNLESVSSQEEGDESSTVELTESQAENPQFNIDSNDRAVEIMRAELGEVGVSMLRRQLERLTQLNREEGLQSPLREALNAGDPRLPKGTLFHNVRPITSDVLESIAEVGIISGELVGVIEESETHGCADFWRVPQDMSLTEYLAFCQENIPDTNIQRKERIGGLTFIVDPNAEGVDELLEYDGYSNPDMQPFINPLQGRTVEDTAAILGGMPRGSIAGILASDALLVKEGMLKQIQSRFPGIPIINHDGVLQA